MKHLKFLAVAGAMVLTAFFADTAQAQEAQQEAKAELFSHAKSSGVHLDFSMSDSEIKRAIRESRDNVKAQLETIKEYNEMERAQSRVSWSALNKSDMKKASEESDRARTGFFAKSSNKALYDRHSELDNLWEEYCSYKRNYESDADLATFDKTEVDFGTVKPNNDLTFNYHFTGKVPVLCVYNRSTAGQLAISTPKEYTESGDVTVKCDTRRLAGREMKRQIRVQFTDGDANYQWVYLTVRFVCMAE